MKRFTLLIALLGLLAGPVYSISQRGDRMVSLNFGETFPQTELSSFSGSTKIGMPGLAMGGQFLYYLRDRLALGADLGYLSSGQASSSDLFSAASSQSSFHSTVLMALLRYNFGRGKWTPYGLFGLGMNSNSIKVSATPNAGSTWTDTHTRESRDLVHRTQSGTAAAFALGMDYFMNERVFLGLEARYQMIGNASFIATANTTTSGATRNSEVELSGSLSTYNLFARAGYRFGGPLLPPPQKAQVQEAPIQQKVASMVAAPAAPTQCPALTGEPQRVAIRMKSKRRVSGRLINCDARITVLSGIFRWSLPMDEVASIHLIP